MELCHLFSYTNLKRSRDKLYEAWEFSLKNNSKTFFIKARLPIKKVVSLWKLVKTVMNNNKNVRDKNIKLQEMEHNSRDFDHENNVEEFSFSSKLFSKQSTRKARVHAQLNLRKQKQIKQIGKRRRIL